MGMGRWKLLGHEGLGDGLGVTLGCPWSGMTRDDLLNARSPDLKKRCSSPEKNLGYCPHPVTVYIKIRSPSKGYMTIV